MIKNTKVWSLETKLRLWLCFIFVLLYALVNPFVNAAFNDSWSYAFTARNFHEFGVYQLCDWLGTPLVIQTILAYPFLEIFGNNFNALILCSLTFSLLLAQLVFHIICKETDNKWLGFLFAVLLFINPIYFTLSITFLTDLYFCFWLIISVYGFNLYVQNNKIKWFCLGLFAAVFAMLTRQFAVLIPIALFVYSVIHLRDWKKSILSFCAFVVVFGSYQIHNIWMEAYIGIPEYYHTVSEQATDNTMYEMLFRTFMRIGYIIIEPGLWLLPLWLFLFLEKAPVLLKRVKYLLLPVVIILIPAIRASRALPIGNIIYDKGIGPITTQDAMIRGMGLDTSNPLFWKLVQPFAIIGAFLLVCLFVNRVYEIFFTKEEKGKALYFWMIIMYIGLLFISVTYFDRYAIPLLILYTLLLLNRKGSIVYSKAKKVWLFVTVLFMLAMTTFTLKETSFYLRWNALTWQIGNELKEQGVPVTNIDAGFEFNGYHGQHILPMAKWEVENKDWIVSFSKEISGYSISKDYRIANYGLYQGDFHLFLLKKD